MVVRPAPELRLAVESVAPLPTLMVAEPRSSGQVADEGGGRAIPNAQRALAGPGRQRRARQLLPLPWATMVLLVPAVAPTEKAAP